MQSNRLRRCDFVPFNLVSPSLTHVRSRLLDLIVMQTWLCNVLPRHSRLPYDSHLKFSLSLTLSFSKEVCFIKMGWALTCIFETYRFQSFFFINDILGDIVFVLLHFPIFRFLFIRRVYMTLIIRYLNQWSGDLDNMWTPHSLLTSFG